MLGSMAYLRQLRLGRTILVGLALVFSALAIGDGSWQTVEGSDGVLFLYNSQGSSLLAWLCMLAVLVGQLKDHRRHRDELLLAKSLQDQLLPETYDAPPGYELAVAYEGAMVVAGDFFQLQALNGKRFVLAVGDASGHGMGAGLIMAVASAALRTAIARDPRPEAVVEEVNRTLHTGTPPRAFATLLYGLLDVESGELELSLHGHPPILLRRTDGSVAEVGEGGLPLGLRRSLPVTNCQLTLNPGDVLLAFTDGLPEALGAGGEPLGYLRLKDEMAKCGTADETVSRFSLLLSNHLGRRQADDDVSLVALARAEAANQTDER